MNQHEKTVKILESFLKDYTMEGVCSFFVDSEEGSEYEEDRIAVYIVLDLDWVNKEFTKPGFVANRMRAALKEEIKKYTGLDVYVGSTARKCEENINESMSLHVRRRLDFNNLKQEIDNIVDYEFHVCRYPNAGEFISEVCDMLNERILDDIVDRTRVKVSLKEKDELYFYFVDTFGNYLNKKYNSICKDKISESKKTYVVTESQYKKLLSEDPDEISKENSIKFYKLFKKIMDGKFSELTYDENPYWSTHEDDVAWSDSSKDIIRYNDYTFLIDRDFYWTFMNYLPISHTTIKLMFARYFREKFPDKFFLSVQEFDS
jgi:hypothetical protein